MVYYISIGENCVIARQLFLHGIRYEGSLPFDWACSNPLAIIDFLESDVEKREVSKHYPGFVNQQLYWPHHDIFLTDDKCFEYVKRCNERLQEILKSGKEIVFLHFTPTGKESNHEALIKFSECIDRLYPGLKYRIFSSYLKLIGDENESESESLTWYSKIGVTYCVFNVKQIWCIEIRDWSGENNSSKLWKEFFEVVRK